MKMIALALIAANILYFGYSLWVRGSIENSVPPKAEEPEAVKMILLLSDVAETGDDRSREAEVVLNNPINTETELAANCPAVGPFDEIMAAQDVSERLSSMGSAGTLRTRDEPTGEFDYRVILPPAASLQEAFRQLRELKNREIESYVITQGEEYLAISLGVFSTQPAAIKHQDNLRKNGYTSEIKQIQRLLREYWIYGQSEFPKEIVDMLQIEYPDMVIAELACLTE